MPENFSEDLGKLLRIRKADNRVDKPDSSFLIEFHRGREDKNRVFGLNCDLQENQASILPGAITAFHYHPEKKVEMIHVLEPGRGLVVVACAPLSGDFYCERVMPGYKFNIPKGLAHALINDADAPAYIWEIANLKFNPQNPKFDVTMLGPEFFRDLYRRWREIAKL